MTSPSPSPLLPPLYTQPSVTDLISVLEALALAPPTWAPTTSHLDDQPRPYAQNGVSIPAYLTGIVASPLHWISPEKRERVWELASRRLSERAGRTAFPSLSRIFAVDNPFTGSVLSIILHEPSLTADNLGHKTWLASYLLAKRLHRLLPHVTPANSMPCCGASSPQGSAALQILELGAGTGLVGITAAILFPAAHVYLTDLPAIVSNLQANVSQNAHLMPRATHKFPPTIGVLDWASLDFQKRSEDDTSLENADVIIAADPLYSSEHPAWLAGAICQYLRRARNARVIVELPLREAYARELQVFKDLMAKARLALIEHGEESSVEDWGAISDGAATVEVRCWWGVWKWEDGEEVAVEAYDNSASEDVATVQPY